MEGRKLVLRSSIIGVLPLRPLVHMMKAKLRTIAEIKASLRVFPKPPPPTTADNKLKCDDNNFHIHDVCTIIDIKTDEFYNWMLFDNVKDIHICLRVDPSQIISVRRTNDDYLQVLVSAHVGLLSIPKTFSLSKASCNVKTTPMNSIYFEAYGLPTQGTSIKSIILNYELFFKSLITDKFRIFYKQDTNLILKLIVDLPTFPQILWNVTRISGDGYEVCLRWVEELRPSPVDERVMIVSDNQIFVVMADVAESVYRYRKVGVDPLGKSEMIEEPSVQIVEIAKKLLYPQIQV